MRIVSISLFIALIGLAFAPVQFHFQGRNKTRQVGGSAQFINFNLQHCHQNHCLEIKAPDAVESRVFGIISFVKARVKHTSAEFSAEGYYDISGEKIFFENVQNEDFTQAYFDFKTGELTKIQKTLAQAER